MNKVEIYHNARKIGALLSDHRRWSYEKLLKASGLSELDLHAALGWLARENKIEFEKDHGSYYCFTGVNVYIG